MKRVVATLIFTIGALIMVIGLRSVRYKNDYDIRSFATLPVLSGGRLKPLDSAARNTLLVLHGKQSFYTQRGEKKSAIEWLMDTAMHPEVADNHPLFRIDHADWLGFFKDRQNKKKYFSFNELKPYLQQIERQAQLINPEAQLRTPYEQAIFKLQQALIQYHRLVSSFHVPDPSTSIEKEYESYLALLSEGREALNQRLAEKEYDQATLERFLAFANRYHKLSEMASLRIIPPPEAEEGEAEDWKSVGASLLETIGTNQIDPVVLGYARVVDAYRAEAPASFNEALAALCKLIDQRYNLEPGTISFEYFFNRLEPFYTTILVYALIFLVACLSWLFWSHTLNRTAYWLLLLAFAVHTFGLVARMYVQGRPPVTNLYSSAIFVGWVVGLLCLILERIYRNGIGSAVAALIGFCTLIIAHHLSKLGTSGDTLEMMRAVLDSNFWLSTHVPSITIGYAATFLAGFLGIIYIVRGFFTKSLDQETAVTLTRMVYGIVCFALFFSFVGTVLGGIWADQSWGRFWGWDPKENGALMIVLWNAIFLHAHWGRLVQGRGLMVLAVGGNIITSWSWFGTNMLGIGLHAYGFMDKAFFWLMAFVLSQLIIIGIGLLPPAYWRSGEAFGKS